MEQNYPIVMAGLEKPRFFIGRFTFEEGYGGRHMVWIQRDGGEGADFDAAELEALIRQFFDERF